jgi:hypothetical protein
MQTRLEAPAEGPPFYETGVSVTGVQRRFPARRRRPPVQALGGLSVDVAAGEVLAVSARPAAASRRCSS